MKRLTVDDVRTALPDLDELRPILEELLGRSEPDGTKAWSGSAQLDTVGSRLVPDTPLAELVATLADGETDRLRAAYALVGKALVAMAAGEGHAAAEALLALASTEEERDRPDRALAYSEAAYRAVQGERDRSIAALALRRAGRASRALGDLGDALLRYKRAHDLARDMSDARGAAEAAIGAGNVLEEQGQWDGAESWYRVALETLEAVEEPTPERWHALLTLHIVARSRGAIEDSLPLLRQAEEAAAAAEDLDAATPFIENARGQLFMAQGAYDEADRHFRSALAAAEHTRARVTIRLNLAESLLARGRALDAAEHAREAEREAIRARMVPKLPEVYRLLGRIASAEGNPDAFVLFERAVELVRERRLPVLEEALTVQAYAEAEAHRGEGDTARQLREEARERFGVLGVTLERQRWADVFGPSPDTDFPAQGPGS